MKPACRFGDGKPAIRDGVRMLVSKSAPGPRIGEPGFIIMSQRLGVVAIIDDSSEIRSALKSLLSAYGYTTELYASAAAFLKARSQSEARCLIVDVQLGDSCGIALVRQLAQLGPALPVIFITASDNP